MSTFRSSIGLIPKTLDTRSVRSTSDWLLFYHIVMPLTRLSETSQYEGYLAKSWKISDDYKTYTFTVADKRFSDGTKITAADVVATIRSQMKKGETVHFDFREIDDVSIITSESFSIRLKHPSKNLLAQASQFEFGVIHPSEIDLPEGNRRFLITSGPYAIKKYEEKIVTLERNKYFDNWLPGAPEEVQFFGAQENNIVALIESKTLDCVEAFVDPGPHHAAIQNRMKAFRPMLTQSAWIGLNAQSPALKDIKIRRYIQKLILQAKIDFQDLVPGVEPTDQLFVPGNPGRFSQLELTNIWKDVRTTPKPKGFPKSIRFAIRKKHIVTSRVVEALRKQGLVIDVVEFEFKDLHSLLKNKHFDLIFTNNDFSATETLENLLVAMSQELPLIQLPKNSTVPGLLGKAQKMFEGSERHALAKSVALALLEEAVVVPIAYYNYIYYVNPVWEISNWSVLTGDTPIWRITQKKD